MCGRPVGYGCSCPEAIASRQAPKPGEKQKAARERSREEEQRSRAAEPPSKREEPAYEPPEVEVLTGRLAGADEGDRGFLDDMTEAQIEALLIAGVICIPEGE